MANLKAGSTVEFRDVSGTFKVLSTSRTTRGMFQVVLENDERRICVTRHLSAFKIISSSQNDRTVYTTPTDE
jgi:hypothetical protein